jgi:hypothetical protein
LAATKIRSRVPTAAAAVESRGHLASAAAMATAMPVRIPAAMIWPIEIKGSSLMLGCYSPDGNVNGAGGVSLELDHRVGS